VNGKLLLVPTTLGGERTAHILPADVASAVHALDYFIVENAKSARAFLKLVGYPRPIAETRIVELNKEASKEDYVSLLKPLREGIDGGLISEAGAPAVADPGALLVREAHKQGIEVRPLVGPSSILLALMASGLNGQQFSFHGYLPVDDAALRARVRQLEQDSRRNKSTQIFIETPYRNDRLLKALIETCAANTLLCVATHLTLGDESIRTQSIDAWRRAPESAIGKRPSVFLLLAA